MTYYKPIEIDMIDLLKHNTNDDELSEAIEKEYTLFQIYEMWQNEDEKRALIDHIKENE